MNNKLALSIKNPWWGIGRLAITTFILCVIAGFASNTSSKDKVTFHFNPPDQTSFVKTLRQTQTMTSQPSEPQTQIVENKVKYVVLKTDSGYSVTAEPLRPSKKVSEDVSAMLTDILSGIVLTYDLDKQGRLLRIRGTEVVMEKIEKLLPAEMKDFALKSFGKGQTFEQLAEQSAVDTWNDTGMGMLANLVGKTWILNKEYPPEAYRAPLPSDSWLDTLRVKISGPTVYKGNNCVITQFSSELTNPDPNTAEEMGESFRSMVINGLMMMKSLDVDVNEAEKQIPTFQFSDPRAFYKLEQVVDPKTCLIYAETETTTMEALFGVDGGEKSKFELKETKEYSYKYK